MQMLLIGAAEGPTPRFALASGQRANASQPCISCSVGCCLQTLLSFAYVDDRDWHLAFVHGVQSLGSACKFSQLCIRCSLGFSVCPIGRFSTIHLNHLAEQKPSADTRYKITRHIYKYG